MAENGERRPSVRLLRVLVGPGRVFQEVVAEPAFIKPALAVCGIGLVLGLILAPRVQVFTTWVLQHGPANVPPEQAEQVLRAAPTVAAAASVATAVLAPWFVWLVVAGLLKLYAMFTAREASFKALFAVAVYGYLPILIGNALTTVLLLGVPVENFQRVSLSLAAFLPFQKSFLYFFLSKCSPFTWWSLILWGAGGAAAFKTRPGGVTAYLFGLWLAEALALAAAASLNTPAGLG